MGPYLAQPNVDKHVRDGKSFKTKLKYSLCEMQGWRRNMEDAAICELQIGKDISLFAVFDGHGGIQVAKYVEKIFVLQLKQNNLFRQERYPEALVQIFRLVDEMIYSKEGEQQLKIIRKKYDVGNNYGDTKISMSVGCTANVVLITPIKIYTANTGDSRSVLCRKGNAIPLSYDHKPENQQQKKRIYAAGGQIVNGRVNGGLNLSRSLGDFNYKQNLQKSYEQQLITCKPDITETIRINDNDEFILIGCDGIWQKFVNDSSSLITRLSNERKSVKNGIDILKNLLDSLLAKQTSQEIGCDNMTSILIEFI